MQTEIQIRALRPFFLQGRAVPAGSVVSASVLDAGQVVGTGRAEFVNPGDGAVTNAARQAVDAKAAATSRVRGSGWVQGF